MKENIVNYLFIMSMLIFLQMLGIAIFKCTSIDYEKQNLSYICINSLLIVFYLCLIKYMPIYAIILIIIAIAIICFLCKVRVSTQEQSLK